MAVPTETDQNQAVYTSMQVCETLRRATVMIANLHPDHAQLGPLIKRSIVSKFRDALSWMTENDDIDQIMHLVKMCLLHPELELDEVLELWRTPQPGQSPAHYRERMTKADYRVRKNGRR